MDNSNKFSSYASKALLSLAVVGLISCSGEKSASEHFDAAEHNYNEHKWHAAVIELKNSLKIDAGNAEARAMLGRIYSQRGMAEDAEKELKHALELGASLDEIALPLSDALLMQRKTDEVIKQLAIRFSDTPKTISIKSVALGEAFLQKGDLDKATEQFETAEQNTATRQRATIGKALAAQIGGNTDSAKALIDEALSLSETQKAWMTRARIYQATGNLEEAEASYLKVVENSKNNKSHHYQMAMRQLMQLQLGKGDVESAESTLNTLTQSFSNRQPPNELMLTFLRANLAYQKKQFEQASELSGKILLSDSNHPGAKLLSGLSEAQLGRFEQAETHLQSFVAQHPEHEQARKALALVHNQNSEHTKAIEALEPFKENLEGLDKSTLQLLVHATLGSGDASEATSLLKSALERSPNDPELNFTLAQTLVAQDDVLQALEALQSLDGNSAQEQQALLSQAQLLIRSEQYSEALNRLNELEQKSPNMPMAATLKGSVYMLSGDADRARTQFSDVLKAHPLFIPALRSLALLEMKEGDDQAADQVYVSALQAAKDDINPLLFLEHGQILIRQGRFEGAIGQIKKAKNYEKTALQSSVMLSRIYLQQGKSELARSELLQHREKNVPAIWAELGNAQMQSKEYDNALASYQKLANLERNSAVPDYLIATVHFALKQEELATQALDRALVIEPRFLPALLAATNLQLRQGDLISARKGLSKLEAINANAMPIKLIKGHILAGEKRYLEAASVYEDVYALAPTEELLHSIVEALNRANGSPSATEFLEQTLEKSPNDLLARLKLAQLEMNRGNNSKAIELYRSAVASDNDDPIALNNLAWLLREEAPEAALTYALRAHSLLPDNKDIKDTLETIQQKTAQ